MLREVEIVIKWNGKFALTFVQCRAESSAAQSTIPDVSSPPSCRCMSRVVDTLMSTCCHRRTLVHWGSSSTRNAASQMARLPHRTARVVSSTRREVQQRLSWTFFAVNSSFSILRWGRRRGLKTSERVYLFPFEWRFMIRLALLVFSTSIFLLFNFISFLYLLEWHCV